MQSAAETPLVTAFPNLLTSHRREQPDEKAQGGSVPVEDIEKGSSTDSSTDTEYEAQQGEYIWCGIDGKPFLPAVLGASTVLGAVCMLLVQIPLLSRFTGLSQAALSIPTGGVYVIVVALMVWCTFIDPGQDIEGFPPRSHKSWQYPRPIKRYDHYCKYTKNVIGLLNHREFFLMVGGLLLIAVVGIVVDIWIAILIAEKGFMKSLIILALHGSYSATLGRLAAPIFKIHVQCVSRNQLAKEWRDKTHDIANNTSKGDNVLAKDLPPHEYNEHFDNDTFHYDASRNPYDAGCVTNCINFWCQPRWPSDATGDF